MGLILLALALACSGGGGGETLTSAKDTLLEIEMVADTARGKFAEIPAGEEFTIYSDPNRAEAQDADQVKAFFSRVVNGQTVRVSEKTGILTRMSTAPYSVLPESRRIVFGGLPDAGTYKLTIWLGRNFIKEFPEDEEVIFYEGTLDNLSIQGTTVQYNGETTSKLKVPMRNHFELGEPLHVINGFADFSSIPKAKFPELVPFPEYARVSLTSFFPMDDPEFRVFQSTNLKRSAETVPLSHAFQVVGVPDVVTAFSIGCNAGEPTGMVLNGFITRQELLAGRPIQLDLDTTLALSFTVWYPVIMSLSPTINDTINIHQRMLKVVARLHEIESEVRRATTDPIKLYPEELALMLAKFEVIKICIQGDAIGQLSLGAKFNSAVLGFAVRLGWREGLNFWFFPSDLENPRNIEILLPGQSNFVVNQTTKNDIQFIVDKYFEPFSLAVKIDELYPPGK